MEGYDLCKSDLLSDFKEENKTVWINQMNAVKVALLVSLEYKWT